MSITLRAQLWELGRANRMELLVRLAFGLGFIIFDYCLIHYTGFPIEDSRGSMLMLLLWNAIPSAAWSNESGGSQSGSRICLDFTRLIMTVAAFLYLRFLGDWNAVTKVGETLLMPVGEFSAYWWMVELVSVLLLFVITASLSLFVFWMNVLLHPRALFIAFGLMSVGILLIVFDINSEWSLRYVWITYGYLFAVGTFVLCIMGLKKSLDSGFVGKPFFVVTLSVWTVFVCTTVALSIKLLPAMPASIPMVAYVSLGAAMLLVPLSAITAAPMGLAIYRHG